VSRFPRLVALAVAGSLVVAAGGDDDDDAADAPEPTSAPAESESTEPSADAPATTEAEAPTTDPSATPTTAATTEPAPELSGELVIASWGGLSDEVSDLFASGFEEATGVTVRFEPVPGQQVAGMQAQAEAGNVQWDIGDALGGDAAAALVAEDLVAELPEDVAARLEESLPGAVKPFGINYGSLSNVIACNAAIAEKCPTTPAEFFDVENFPGRRTLWADNAQVALALALAADGVPYDQIYPMDLDRAFAKLESIKGEIDVLYSSGDQLEQLFRSGEVAMGIAYNGRAFALSTGEGSDDLDMQTSWEGAVYNPTMLVVYKDSPNPAAAFAYLEWVASHPDVAVEYSETSTYGFPNQAIFDSIDPALGEWLPENPAHFDRRIELDYDWYQQNKQEVDDRWVEFTTG
jgi:putative spermidine/putrescine transport system substrate-binding protein